MNTWQNVSLGELCKVIPGGTPSRSKFGYYGGGIPWVKINDMLQGTILDTEETITEAGLKDSSAKFLPAGTVLISIFATIGRTATLGVDATTNQAIAGLVPYDPKTLLPDYLRRFLDHTVQTLQREARGVAQVNINSKILKEIEIPLPPLATQKAILATLDQADELRMQRKRAISLLDTLVQSIFLEMFGDPGSNPKKWPVTSLGNVITDGPQNGLYKPASSYGSGIPIVRIDAFHHGVIKKLNSLKRLRLSDVELERWMLHPGDVLINRVNSLEYLGKSALVPDIKEPVVFESNMMRFSVDRAVLQPRFLVHVLRSAHLRSQILSKAKNAVNQSSINQSDVRSFEIFLPPRKLQEEYVAVLERIDTLKESALRSMSRLDALFASLQDKAFRGEL